MTRETNELHDRYLLQCGHVVMLMEKRRALINGDKYVRLGTIRYRKDCFGFGGWPRGESFFRW